MSSSTRDEGEALPLSPFAIMSGQQVGAPRNADVAISPFEIMSGRQRIKAPEAEQSPTSTDGASASYLKQSAIAGLHNAAGSLAKAVPEFVPGFTSEGEMEAVADGDPEKLRAAKESLGGRASEYFYDIARGQTQKAADAMQDVSPAAHAEFDDKKYATLDPAQSAFLSPTKVAGDAIQSLPTTGMLMATAFVSRQAAVKEFDALIKGGMAREEARQLAIKKAGQVAAKTGAASEGAVGYTQQALGTENEVLNMPQERLEKSPEYQALVKTGFSPDEARQVLAYRVGEQSGIAAGAVDAATNMVGGKFLGEIIGEGATLAKRSARGAANEGLTETAQSAGEQVGENAAMQRVDPTRQLSDNVVESALQGLGVGGATGGTASAVFGSKSAESVANDGVTDDQYALGDEPDQEGEPLADLPPDGPQPPPTGNQAASFVDQLPAAKGREITQATPFEEQAWQRAVIGELYQTRKAQQALIREGKDEEAAALNDQLASLLRASKQRAPASWLAAQRGPDLPGNSNPYAASSMRAAQRANTGIELGRLYGLQTDPAPATGKESLTVGDGAATAVQSPEADPFQAAYQAVSDYEDAFAEQNHYTQEITRARGEAAALLKDRRPEGSARRAEVNARLEQAKRAQAEASARTSRAARADIKAQAEALKNQFFDYNHLDEATFDEQAITEYAARAIDTGVPRETVNDIIGAYGDTPSIIQELDRAIAHYGPEQTTEETAAPSGRNSAKPTARADQSAVQAGPQAGFEFATEQPVVNESFAAEAGDSNATSTMVPDSMRADDGGAAPPQTAPVLPDKAENTTAQQDAGAGSETARRDSESVRGRTPTTQAAEVDTTPSPQEEFPTMHMARQAAVERGLAETHRVMPKGGKFVIAPLAENPRPPPTATPENTSPPAAPQTMHARMLEQKESQQADTPAQQSIDAAAHEAATSPHNDLPQPTDAQKEAGNYKKGHLSFQGLDIAIENPKGSKRSGVSPDGKRWENTIHQHYGYIKRTEGADGDHVDVFIGDDTESGKVFVIDQIDAGGKFDEHKVMLGFSDKLKAIAGYKKNYQKGWKVGPVTSMTMDEFKAWLRDGNTTNPVADKKDAQSSPVMPVAEKATPDDVVRYRVEVAKREIERDIAQGTIPADKAGTFGQLHEHVDANEYVNDADRADRILGPVGKRLGFKQRDYIDITNRMIDELDDWLQAGRPSPATATKNKSQASASTAPEHAAVGVDDRELSQIVREFNDAQESMQSGDDQIHHLFDAPAKSEIVRLADKVKVYTKEHGWMTPAEAKARVDEWKAHANDQGGPGSKNANKVVLSFFDLTGKWSQPWEDAGYQVYRFDIQADPEVGDVNNFSTEFFNDWFGDFDGQDIYAILAATPCTDFAVSGARHFAAKDADGRTVASVKLVHQTLAAIEYFKPSVWAIENPVGRIESLGGLPPWRLSFDPNHLGETYTKKTLLWGRFNAELPIAPVEPVEGSKMHTQYGGKSLATKNARSATPEGFSYGFFMANNAIDHPAMAIANKFDRLDAKLIAQAVHAGMTESEISEVVEDHYYMDLDDAAANNALREAIDARGPAAAVQEPAATPPAPRKPKKQLLPAWATDAGIENGSRVEVTERVDYLTPGESYTVEGISAKQAYFRNDKGSGTFLPPYQIKSAFVAGKMRLLVDLKELDAGAGSYSQKLDVKIADAKHAVKRARSYSAHQREIQGDDLHALESEVSRLEGLRAPAAEHDARVTRDNASRGLLKMARSELDASDLSSEDRTSVVDRAKSSGSVADAVATILDEVDQAHAKAKSSASVAAEKIDDLGEKIGGARKDTASTGASRPKRAAAEEDAGWRRRYIPMEIMSDGPNKGKWQLADKRLKDRMGGVRIVSPRGTYYDTEAQALELVPLVEVARNHSVRPSRRDGDTQMYVIMRDVSDRKRVQVVDKEFDSRVEALEYMAAHAEEIIETKTSFGEEILPRPEAVLRTGEERRTGPAKGDDFIETFGFRGVEFGNWNNQAERQEVMNHAYDGLLDLAEVLRVPPKALSLNGELALAFGARGQGLSGARAHYETDYGVINLTKMNGAGSLAHEFAHALDHYLGRLDGKAGRAEKSAPGKPIFKSNSHDESFASHGFRTGKKFEMRNGTLTNTGEDKSGARPELREAWNSIIKTMLHKAERYVEDAERAEKFVGTSRNELENRLSRMRESLAQQENPAYYKKWAAPATEDQLKRFDELAAKLVADDAEAHTMRAESLKGRSANIRMTNDVLNELSAIMKKVRNYSGFGSGQKTGTLDYLRGDVFRYRQRLDLLKSAAAQDEHTKTVPTSFLMESKNIDQGRASDYWATRHEMVARAFESYVHDKIREQGNQSVFLVYGTSGAVPLPWGVGKPYPEGSERTALNESFDKFFDVAETKDTERGVALFKRGSGTQESYERRIDELFAGAPANSDGIRVLDKSDVLDLLGYGDMPVVVNESHAFDDGKYSHPLSREQWLQIPDWLENPVAVFRRDDGHLTVIAPDVVDGKPVLIALQPKASPTKSHGNKRHLILTAYVKDRGPLPVPRMISDGGLLFVDTRKSPGFNTNSGLRLPSRGADLQGFGYKVYTGADLFKYRASPNYSGTRRQPASGNDAKQVKNWIAPVLLKWQDGPVVEVVQSMTDLPAHIQEDFKASSSYSPGDVIHGAHDAESGIVYLVADHITDGDHAQRTLAHEAVGHWGVEDVVGEKMPELLRKVDALSRTDKRVTAIGAAVDQEYPGVSDGVRAAEIIAHMAESGMKHVMLDLWIGKLRNFLRRIGFTLQFSNADLRGILAQAARRLETGKGGGHWAATSKPKKIVYSQSRAAAGSSARDDAPKQAARQYTPKERREILSARGEGGALPVALGALSLRMLADVAEKQVPEIALYQHTVTEMQAMRNRMAEKTDAEVKEWMTWAKKNKARADQLTDMMYEATIAGADPDRDFVPLDISAAQKRIAILREQKTGRSGEVAQHLLDEMKELEELVKGEPKRREDYERLKPKFDGMNNDQKRFYRQVRDAYERRFDETQKLLEERISAAIADQHSRRAAIDAMRARFESAKVRAPYFPLQRFGRFWLETTTEPGGKGEREFYMFDNAGEQTAMKIDLRKKGFKYNIGTHIEESKQLQGVTGGFINELMGRIDEQQLNEEKRAALKDDVYQLLLATLPVRSMRKQFIHRKKVAGYSHDAIRSYASSMLRGAYQLSRLKYAHHLQDLVLDASANSKTKGSNRATDMANELIKRHEWVMNPKSAPLAQKLTSFGFFMHLGLTAAGGVVNMLQTWTVAMPVIASHFGAQKSAQALVTASGEFLKGGKKLSLESGLTGDEAKAYKELHERGVIDKTQSHDLMSIAESDTTAYTDTTHRVMNIISFVFHKAEVYNREVTAMAAYRLAREAGQPFDEAVALAEKVTIDAHFDYSNVNRARYIQNNFMKVFAQFKQYALNMTYFLVRNAYLALMGESKQIKRMALTQLVGTLGMTSALGGALALPLGVVFVPINLLAAALSMFGGDDDDDEPFDAESEFVWMINRIFRKHPETAKWILRGAGSQLTGYDLTSRIGLGDLWVREPDRDIDGENLWMHYAEQLLGPVLGGSFVSLFRAHEIYKKDDDPMRAIEAAAPKALRDIMRFARYVSKGATTKNGASIIEKFSPTELAGQLFGFVPVRLAEQYDENGRLKRREQAILNRRSQLGRLFAKSIIAKDLKKSAEVMAEIKAFNKKYPEKPIAGDYLRQVAGGMVRGASMVENGVQLDRRLKDRLRREAGLDE